MDELPPDKSTSGIRLRRLLFGRPHDLGDRSIFHRLSLIPFLAWIGLGADGLSSSSYGPEEAFRTLGEHKYLAIALAMMMAGTIFVISAAYSRIIEQFPHGGGGYVVATKLLGERAGAVSGCALLVDYILTITTSIAAAGDALFSLVPEPYLHWKLLFEVVCIVALVTLNIRGVKESVTALAPIFLLFLFTHAVLIIGCLVKAPSLGETVHQTTTGFQAGLGTLGAGGMFLLFIHAYSLGGGTYTGIEAVSNGLPIMREPRVRTARRTMIYMATSLAVTASGLIVCYLLWNISYVPGKTMNALLVGRLTAGRTFGEVFVFLTLVSEGALLVVAAQTGFLDGPRVIANMAVDSWMPHRFSALSERLTTHNGIALMGTASLAALLYTGGDIRSLVVMYSINVFLTFSLSLFGMARSWFQTRKDRPRWKRRFSLFLLGFVLCATILGITVFEKFLEGGWITLTVTGCLVVVCFLIRRHYRALYARLARLYQQLEHVADVPQKPPGPPDATKPTAAILVGNYGGLGIHTMLNVFRVFPGHFHNIVFLSVGVVDSGGFKGDDAIHALTQSTEEALAKYVDLARRLGIPATFRMGVGTDAVEEADKLCDDVLREFPRTTFFAGKVLFERENWIHRLLHNETAVAIQRRLHWAGKMMVIIPARVR
ncbi:MAG: APC family permease [Planctomycetes bacterium]|nr:APC family permease [Planctomycetota bacterium]MBI3845007.1 APC family permease [Planctomycetota bacterium]